MATKADIIVQKDAQNRALRTLLQGLAFDVTAAGVLVLFTAFSAAQAWTDLQWTIIGFTLFKSVMVSGLSYLMRRVFTNKFLPADKAR